MELSVCLCENFVFELSCPTNPSFGSLSLSIHKRSQSGASVGANICLEDITQEYYVLA